MAGRGFRRNTTSQFLMSCLQQRRIEDRKREEAQRLDRNRQMSDCLQNQEDFDRRRHLQKLHIEQKEKQTENHLLQAEEEKINREKQFEQEERLAKELARINYEKQREERMRQYVKENSTELRELEVKLNAAYVSKERAAQIAEKKAMKLQAMCEEADYLQKLKSEQELAVTEQEKLEQRHRKEALQHQKELEQQLVEKERRRQEAYKELLKEKLLVDEIVRKIYEEDQTARQLKMEKALATQQEIEEFQRQQAAWRQMEQKRMEAENRRIMEFANYKEDFEKILSTKTRERAEARQQFQKMVFENIEMEKQMREELEQDRVELYVLEKEEANRQKEAEDMEKKIRQRLTLLEAHQEEMAFREMRRQAQKEEEEAFRKLMMDKLAEDDRIEQMNAGKRRMKQLEHRREVEKLIEERRKQREVEMELEAKERATEEEREAIRRQIIEEERQKLLQRHATNLIGHLPKGLLQERDLEHFSEDFRDKFKIPQVDLFSEEGWESDS
ncbi:meiosis-specific nuclear structural protein 1 [Thalassophryne amazonica]|uniref:meiosis-specific nuclear structural protein 1 n=1 Tax=Thalassophryne amazonica TaxID=390379 RepID=UPI00147115F9|nr:meiosis-specific nuclear structural protein 1 [Thalassophryne amazonica]